MGAHYGVFSISSPLTQPFIEGTNGVQLLSGITLADMDHSTVANITEAQVRNV